MTEDDRNLFNECLAVIRQLKSENQALAEELRRVAPCVSTIDQACCVILRDGGIVMRSQSGVSEALKIAQVAIQGFLTQERKATEHLLQ